MYKCKALSWWWSYYNEWLWEIKETEKMFRFKCIEKWFHIKENFNLKKEYYPNAIMEDWELIVYILKTWMPYIFNEIIYE